MQGNAVIETGGLSDSALYAQVMAGLRRSYNTYGKGNGNYPKVENILTDRVVNNVWTKNYLDAKVFIDGKGVTSVTAMDTRASGVRVPLMAPPPFTPRTIAMEPYIGVNNAGTPGNDGLENIMLPNTPQTDGVDIKFNQVYDRATNVFKISQNMLSMDILGKYNSMIPSAVANMTDSFIMATQLSAGLFRGYRTNNGNIVPVKLSTNEDGYLQGVMNGLISTMTNPKTAWSEGVVQYDLNGCVILMKQSFWDKIFTVKNGALVNGGNITTEILQGGAFTKDGQPLGNNIKGIYSGVYIKVVPDSYWAQAAAYMGLTPEQFAQYNKVQAYICSSEGTGFGRLDQSINPIPNPGNSIGTKVQTLFQWGAEVIRDSSIGMIVSTESDTPLQDFTNPVTKKINIVAPANFNKVIESYGTPFVDYGDEQYVGVIGGDKATTVTLTVNGTGSTPIKNASLEILDGEGQYKFYTNGADGTYTFVLDRGDTATVEVSATGYQNATVNITAENTETATYAVTQTLTAQA